MNPKSQFPCLGVSSGRRVVETLVRGTGREDVPHYCRTGTLSTHYTTTPDKVYLRPSEGGSRNVTLVNKKDPGTHKRRRTRVVR